MDSHLRRHQWLARVQAVEIGRMMFGEGEGEAKAATDAPPARAANGARYVPPSQMLKTLGVVL